MDLNKAMIIGYVTQDPEARMTPQGTAVTSFSVATNLVWTDQSGVKQSKVEFHNIVAWRKLAEICAQYLKKGKRVYVEGRLQTRDWEDQTGVKRYRTEIVADNMILLDRAFPQDSVQAETAIPSQTQTQPTSSGTEPYPAPSMATAPQQSSKTSTDAEIRVEDIPF